MGTNYPTVYKVYIVAWHDQGIIKVGVTQVNRWSAFVGRGASLFALYKMPGWREMFDLETVLATELARHGVDAFRSAAEAAGHLGSKGGGYLECKRVPEHQVEHVLRALLKHVPEHAIELVPEIRIRHVPPSIATLRDGTNGTNEESGSVERLILRNERARFANGSSSRWAARMTASYAAVPHVA